MKQLNTTNLPERRHAWVRVLTHVMVLMLPVTLTLAASNESKYIKVVYDLEDPHCGWDASVTVACTFKYLYLYVKLPENKYSWLRHENRCHDDREPGTRLTLLVDFNNQLISNNVELATVTVNSTMCMENWDTHGFQPYPFAILSTPAALQDKVIRYVAGESWGSMIMSVHTTTRNGTRQIESFGNPPMTFYRPSPPPVSCTITSSHPLEIKFPGDTVARPNTKIRSPKVNLELICTENTEVLVSAPGSGNMPTNLKGVTVSLDIDGGGDEKIVPVIGGMPTNIPLSAELAWSPGHAVGSFVASTVVTVAIP